MANPLPDRVPDELTLDQAQVWLQRCAQYYPRLGDPNAVPSAVVVHPQLPNALIALHHLGATAQDIAAGIEFILLACELNLDIDSMLAALSYRAVRAGRVDADELAQAIGSEAAHLLESVLKMASTRLLELSNAPLHGAQAQDQVNNVKAMLLSMIDDVRVAILKLSERVVALRRAKSGDEQRRRRIAHETELVFAPLARRLGIRRLKWELEDLSLRYLDPERYHGIAQQLDGRRAERERSVSGLAVRLEDQLQKQGLSAQVAGRAKNIYSIWRKMQHKGVSLAEVYDVSAVRVLVPDIAQCYAALGLIHTGWTHIPAEFDDYIAVPKDNGYRSIHTALVDAEGMTLEVQIRTFEMHHEAELGICAHWAYKDEAAEQPSTYTNKMNWLRNILEAQENLGLAQDLPSLLLEQIEEDRIFVYTPKGHVIDLAAGATPIDFAYAIHSEVGHQCRAALVDGLEVALNQPLASGQRIEVRAASAAMSGPNRRWLDAHLGIVNTARAREKILAWLRAQEPQEQASIGREHLAQLVARLPILPPIDALLNSGSAKVETNTEVQAAALSAMLGALALGEIHTLDVLRVLLIDAFGRDAELFEQVRSRLNAPILLTAQDRDGLLRDVALLLSGHGIGMLSTSAKADKVNAQAKIVIELDDDHAIAADVLAPEPLALDSALGYAENDLDKPLNEVVDVLLKQAWVLDLLADIPGVIDAWRE